MVAYECDYPHSDTLWPEVPERLWTTIKHLTDAQIDKITHSNAMRFFHFDPFKHHKREELTVGALRAKAAADGVDTDAEVLGRREAAGRRRDAAPVTSGDLMKMFAHHAKGGSKDKAA